MTATDRPGALVLVATPIGNLGDLSPRAVDELRDADVIACEDTRRTRALLTHAHVPATGRLRAVHAHNEAAAAEKVVAEVTAGLRVAYVSDAGMPGVSDPGARLVSACIDAGLAVEVVPGPSAVITALVVSGLPTDRFVFEGFLPRRGPDRRARLAAIADETRTVVLYESPRRVSATLADLVGACGPDRRAALVREMTKRFEEVRRASLDELARDCPAEPRGEHVVVVAGASPAPVPDEGAVERAVAAAIGRGCSARDAAAEVARDLAVPKRQAYEIAVRLTRR
ncbi:MAG: 16S rRNA (cytidine(1402)-2'-O)-methyltransferase [Actinobacteria bacterium]|nr:16S rRNA (cytidine(1402)-2'-O)-methyltransferase [Actinomycetota bacterium]